MADLKTPFRYDYVGSFLRPEALKQARKNFEEGKITKEELTAVEDDCIRDLVGKIKKLGYHVITDGEFRRSTWHLDFMWGFQGIEHRKTVEGNTTFDAEAAMIDDTYMVGKISVKNHPFVEHFKFVKALEDENTVAKQTIPSPGQFYAYFTGAELLGTTLDIYGSEEAFAKDVASVLADDGLWHFEQSYMPSMLRTNAYDTICHEHLEFYSFKVVQFILRQCGMRVVDVETNGINGGSFAVTACKESAPFVSNRSVIEWLLRQEEEMQLATVAPYVAFAERMRNHRQNLRDLLNALVADGKKILGYGASTKGNVLLQYCGIGVEHLPCIAEVNEDKFGAYTPGTNIPIVSEAEARAMKPDYFFVLPWHFKAGILEISVSRAESLFSHCLRLKFTKLSRQV